MPNASWGPKGQTSAAITPSPATSSVIHDGQVYQNISSYLVSFTYRVAFAAARGALALPLADEASPPGRGIAPRPPRLRPAAGLALRADLDEPARSQRAPPLVAGRPLSILPSARPYLRRAALLLVGLDVGALLVLQFCPIHHGITRDAEITERERRENGARTRDGDVHHARILDDGRAEIAEGGRDRRNQGRRAHRVYPIQPQRAARLGTQHGPAERQLRHRDAVGQRIRHEIGARARRTLLLQTAEVRARDRRPIGPRDARPGGPKQ